MGDTATVRMGSIGNGRLVVHTKASEGAPWIEVPADKPLGTPPEPCACERPIGGHLHSPTTCWSDKDTMIAARSVAPPAWGSGGRR